MFRRLNENADRDKNRLNAGARNSLISVIKQVLPLQIEHGRSSELSKALPVLSLFLRPIKVKQH